MPRTLSSARWPERRSLLKPAVREQLGCYRPEDGLAALYRTASGDDLARMQTVDSRVLLPDDFLTKVDRASMSVGLEVRPPLLDHRLLEWASRLPTELKLRHGEGKQPLRRLLAEDLGWEFLARKKQGFELPLAEWMRGELAEPFRSLVCSRSGPVSEFIDAESAQSLFDRHLSGSANHGQVLWSLLTLAAWCNEHLSRTTNGTPP